jgi:hypothetical protein
MDVCVYVNWEKKEGRKGGLFEGERGGIWRSV